MDTSDACTDVTISTPSHSTGTPPQQTDSTSITFVSKRTHKKSRTGCRRCKSRKVKCDETKPACGNCIKIKAECDFTPLKPLPRPSGKRAIPRATSSTSSSASVPRPQLALPSDPFPTSPSTDPSLDRLTELRLWHHYIHFSTARQYLMPFMREVRVSILPSLAFRSRALLDGILSFAALHLHDANPDDEEEKGILLQASQRYMTRAMGLHLSTLRGGLNEENFEGCYVMAIVVAFHAVVMRRFGAACGEDEVVARERVPLHWFQTLQGVDTVMRAGRQEWVKHQALFRFLPRYVPSHQCGERSEGCPFGFLVEGLREEEVGREVYEAYHFAVTYLCDILCQPYRIGYRTVVLRFMSSVPPLFVQLVQQQDPRALTIVGSFFAILKIIDDVWWLHGTGEREVKVIQEMLPPEWSALVERVKEMVWVEPSITAPKDFRNFMKLMRAPITLDPLSHGQSVKLAMRAVSDQRLGGLVLE